MKYHELFVARHRHLTYLAFDPIEKWLWVYFHYLQVGTSASAKVGVTVKGIGVTSSTSVDVDKYQASEKSGDAFKSQDYQYTSGSKESPGNVQASNKTKIW